MTFGPLTFQCACLQCNCRSTASARHSLHSSMSSARFVSDTSIPVAYIGVLVLSAVLRPLLSACCLFFNDRLYGRYQFRSAHRITDPIDKSSGCACDPVVEAAIKVLQYAISIDAAGHLAIECLKVNPNLLSVPTKISIPQLIRTEEQ